VISEGYEKEGAGLEWTRVVISEGYEKEGAGLAEGGGRGGGDIYESQRV